VALDPEAAQLLAQLATLPRIESLSVDAARALLLKVRAGLGPGDPVDAVEDHALAGPQGPIPIRLYRPQGTGPWPVVVYFHGGGWVLGDLDSDDTRCRAIANHASCLVASVNYRHAPEHPFPAAVADADAATATIAARAAEWQGDPDRIAVAGVSAGANLAAVVARHARDRGGPRLAAQVLIVPVTDCALDTPSYRQWGEGYGLDRRLMEWFWRLYVPTPQHRSHPDASPLRATDLAGLPPALVITAAHDVLRDEGAAYAERLASAGVTTEHRCYEGMVHLFLGPRLIPDVAARLRTAFAPAP
jgi:acetyl esterase